VHKFCATSQKLIRMSEKLFHVPVLKDEILALLFFDEVRTVFDGTLGLGGHAEAILSQFPQITQYVACDLDSQHLEFSKKRLEKWDEKITFQHTNFSHIREILEQLQIDRPLAILLDLGICSNHVDDPAKGFSFEKDGPLSMAFDDSREGAAAKFLNAGREGHISEILKTYGDEPRAKFFARKIVQAREEKQFETTKDLRELIEKNAPPHQRKKTLMRIFQALRIVVNDELTVLQETLQSAFEILESGDRIGVISYHSLEDRIVKQCFSTVSRPTTEETDLSLHTVVAEPTFRLLTRKPIAPGQSELLRNPRSRSARFRVLEKI